MAVGMAVGEVMDRTAGLVVERAGGGGLEDTLAEVVPVVAVMAVAAMTEAWEVRVAETVVVAAAAAQAGVRVDWVVAGRMPIRAGM